MYFARMYFAVEAYLPERLASLLERRVWDARNKVRGIAMTDVGLRLLDSLYDQLVIDDRWAVRREGEFTWWANHFAQHVEVEPPEWVDGRYSCAVRIWTEVVADVDEMSTDPLAVLAVINRSATLSALVWDQWNGTISEHCSATVDDENFTWLSKMLITAAVLQNGSAQSRAHSLAIQTGGVPALSAHPSAGQRPEMDDLLNVSRQAIAAEGDRPSQFIGNHFRDVGDFLDRMSFAGSADLHRLTCEVPFALTPLTPAPGGQAKVQMFTDAPHPEAGAGLLCILTLPYIADARHIVDQADMLNRWQSTGDTDTALLGAWCSAPSSESTLAFRLFVPNALSKWVTIENLVSYMATQSLFAPSRLRALPGAVAWSANSNLEQARATRSELTVARSDLELAFCDWVYRTYDGRILTYGEAFDELTPEIAEGLEELPPEDRVINGGDVESYIRENGIYQLIDVKPWIVTQYTDGRTRWTSAQLSEQVFTTSDHGDSSFEDWLVAQLDSGALAAVEVLQFIGYEDEDADGQKLITERLIID
jgi:hypothetical protein